MTNSSDAQTPAALWEHISRARWFAGKGRNAHPGRLVPLDWYVHGEDLAVRSVLVEAVLPEGSEFYQLLLSHRATPAEDGLLYRDEQAELPHVHDALQDPAALRALVDCLAIQSETPTWVNTVTRPADLSGQLRVFGGEQSNTSVMVGDVAMVKFFRRLEPGANLDIAVHDALGRAGVDAVAKLHGWLSAHVDEEVYDLAMVVQQLPEARDGWEVATDAAAEGRDFTEDAAALGRALAHIHLALSDTFPTATLDSEMLVQTMVDRLHTAAREATDLGPMVPALEERFGRLASQKVGAQRVHGDFHLGQTLLTADGWRIIDFEGEPIKTLEERREPDSRWRDVAGMMRSLAYATSAFPDAHDPAAQQWLQDCQAAFLDAYNEAVSGTRGSSADRPLLEAYVADKAIYEVVYETRNRPDWVAIPMGALRALVADSDPRAATSAGHRLDQTHSHTNSDKNRD